LYTASITLPSTGDWSVTIRSGFGRSDITLLPLAASTRHRPNAAGNRCRARTALSSRRGASCHEQIEVGPKLEGKRFDVTYIRASSRTRRPRRRVAAIPMPNLGLQQREIASLVAFLNSDRQVTAR
jgi:hypothetical protein